MTNKLSVDAQRYLINMSQDEILVGVDEVKETLPELEDADVLEHLIEPVDFFLDINKVLKPNGYIVMYTPNIHSIGFELMAEKQNLLHPFEHVCFYNKSSLDFLALQTNFKIISIEFFGLDIMDYLLYKEYQDNYKYTANLQNMMTLVQACLDKLEVSNHMRITLQKI